MDTKISKILNTIIETGWLLIFVLVPLIFIPLIYSVVHIAEYVVFQILVEIIVFAWIMKLIICYNQGRLKSRKNNTIVPNLQNNFSREKAEKKIGRNRAAARFLPALVFIVILGIATIFSQSPHISFWGYYFRKMGYIIWLHFFAFFFVLFFNLKNKAQIMRIFYTIIIAAAISVLYGLIQISGFDPFTWSEPAHLTQRISSTIGQPNFFASWLLLVIPIIIGVLLLSSLGRTLGRTLGRSPTSTDSSLGRSPTSTDTALGMIKSVFKQYFLRPLLIVLFFLSILALIFTQSRGGWIGFFLGFFFFTIIISKGETNGKITFLHLQALKEFQGPLIFSWIKKYKRIGIFLPTLLIISISIIIYFNFYPLDLNPKLTGIYFEHRLRTLTQLYTFGERRLIVWRDSLDLISKKPLIGYGPEVQKLNFVSYYTPESAALEAINAYPDRAHNNILDTLLISGVLGLMSYLFFICVIFYLALKYIFKNYQSRTSIAILSLLTGVFAYLISLQFSFHVIPTAVYFWGYLAIILKLVISTHASNS